MDDEKKGTLKDKLRLYLICRMIRMNHSIPSNYDAFEFDDTIEKLGRFIKKSRDEKYIPELIAINSIFENANKQNDLEVYDIVIYIFITQL